MRRIDTATRRVQREVASLEDSMAEQFMTAPHERLVATEAMLKEAERSIAGMRQLLRIGITVGRQPTKGATT